jgi:hypothetical protein
MWGTLFKQASRLAQEGYSREEVKEILSRAAELQAQAEKEGQAQQKQINQDALRAGAMAAGIRPEFLEQALQEFHARRQAERQGQQQGGKWGQMGRLNLGGNFRVANCFARVGNFGFHFRDHILSPVDCRFGVGRCCACLAFGISLRRFWASHRVSNNDGSHARSDERAKEVAKKALAAVV